MDNTPAAMAQNNPDADAGKELSTAGSGEPAVPADENHNEQLITRPYVREGAPFLDPGVIRVFQPATCCRANSLGVR